MSIQAMFESQKLMSEFYTPKKVNIAIFGNYEPHLHIHIMARFEQDSHFPEPMWGKKQREGELRLLPFEEFSEKLVEVLSKI